MLSCTCGFCGAPFSATKAAVTRGRGKFCSRQCGARASINSAITARRAPIAERYQHLVIQRGDDECWDWSGFKCRGYGRIKIGNRSVGAHRVSYELANGPIPDGMTVLHRCDNPPCTNPSHLFLGTNSDNNRDRHQKGRSVRGERAGRAVLTEAIVRRMRQAYAAGGETHASIAAKFSANLSTTSGVLLRRSWKHVV